jgi:hypothetical protein
MESAEGVMRTFWAFRGPRSPTLSYKDCRKRVEGSNRFSIAFYNNSIYFELVFPSMQGPPRSIVDNYPIF